MSKTCLWTYDKAGQCYHTGCDDTHIDIHDYIGDYCTCCGGRITYGNKSVVRQPLTGAEWLKWIYCGIEPRKEVKVNAN